MSVVLLAEDDPAIAEPLSRALHREGYAVHVVADGPARSTPPPPAASTCSCSTSGCPAWTAWRSAGGCASAAASCRC